MRSRSAVFISLLVLLAVLGGCGGGTASSSPSVVPEEPITEETEEPAVVQTPPEFNSNIRIDSGAEHEDGSSARLRMELDELVAATAFEAPEGFEGLANACDVDYRRDAFVPGKFAVENTTKRFAIEISTGIFVGIGSTAAGEDPYPNLPDVDVAQGFSDGPSCEVGLYPGAGAAAGIDFTIDPHGTGDQNFLIVIHDYYSPAKPGGRKEDAANLRVGIFFPPPLFNDWDRTCVSASAPLDGGTVRIDGNSITDRQFEPAELPSC